MSDFSTEWERPEFDSVPLLAENAVWRLPSCDDTILRKWLQETYRDFCRRSAALRTWRRIGLEAGVAAYPVVPILSSEIDCVTQAVWEHSRIPVRGWSVTGDPPSFRLPYVPAPHGHDFPPARVAYVQTIENVAAMPVQAEGHAHPPIVPRGILVEAVEIPRISEERAPKAFLRRYGDAIIDGALARMFSMSGRAWADAEQAREHAIAYENAVSGARISSMRGSPGANPGATPAIDMSGMV